MPNYLNQTKVKCLVLNKIIGFCLYIKLLFAHKLQFQSLCCPAGEWSATWAYG